MSDDERMTDAELVGGLGILIFIVGSVLLVLAGLGAAVGSAAGWDGWFKTVDIVAGFVAVVLAGVGLFLMGHPPGSGPKFMNKDDPS
jgi:hypothetical protein